MGIRKSNIRRVQKNKLIAYNKINYIVNSKNPGLQTVPSIINQNNNKLTKYTESSKHSSNDSSLSSSSPT